MIQDIYILYTCVIPFHLTGLTTLVSFAVTILLITVYLYYEDLVRLLKKTCIGRRPVADQPTFERAAKNGGNVAGTSGIHSKVSLEPAVACECGQVHILRKCLNEKQLKPYQTLFCHLMSSEDTEMKYGAVVGTSVKDHQQALPQSSQLREDSPDSSSTESISDTTIHENPSNGQYTNDANNPQHSGNSLQQGSHNDSTVSFLTSKEIDRADYCADV